MRSWLSLFILLLGTTLFAQEVNIYREASRLEREKSYKEAVVLYKKFLSLSKNRSIFDRVQLKIARISPNYADKIIEFNRFFKYYPNSRFRFIARYELANLRIMAGELEEAHKELESLIEISQGNPYWQKGLLLKSRVEISQGRYKEALYNLYSLLEEINDYEDLGTAYFYLGEIMYKQASYDEAIEYFLICAGSFPASSRASTALLELAAIYFKRGWAARGKLVVRMLGEMYPDSPEYYGGKELAAPYRSTEAGGVVNLINLNSDQEIERKVLERLRSDLKLSGTIYEKEETAPKAGLFIQLGYYSRLDYAKEFIERSKAETGLEKVFYRAVRSTKSGKIYYRILTGPLKGRAEANKKLIELKEKNIEGIILELTTDYE